MPETLTYTTPQAVAPAANTVRVIGFEMIIEPNPFIRIMLMDDHNRPFDVYYREDEGALALILALNKANLSVKSLQKRIMERLLTDQKLAAGSIGGAPD